MQSLLLEAQSNKRESTWRNSVSRQKQGRERLWAFPPVRGSAVTRRSHLGQLFWVFVFLQASYLVSFPTPDLPWGPPLGAHLPLRKMGLEVKASGRSKTHMAWHSPSSSDPRSRSVHAQCLPCPKSLGRRSRSPLLTQAPVFSLS